MIEIIAVAVDPGAAAVVSIAEVGVEVLSTGVGVEADRVRAIDTTLVATIDLPATLEFPPTETRASPRPSLRISP